MVFKVLAGTLPIAAEHPTNFAAKNSIYVRSNFAARGPHFKERYTAAQESIAQLFEPNPLRKK